jgi:diaminopimelate decarboxylase
MGTIFSDNIRHAISKYGSPLYFIDQSRIEIAVEQFLNSFNKINPNFKLAYPYKVNNIKRLVQYFYSIGLWAEVSSEIELEMATSLGVLRENIIFNGPYKTIKSLEVASKTGVLIIVDNETELENVEFVAKKNNINISIGIRVNSLEAKNNWGKFGFTIEDGKALEIARKVFNSKRLNLIALHAHFGSNVVDISHYEKMMMLYSEFVADLLQKNLVDLQIVDIGSGFAIPQPRPLGGGQWLVPHLDDYTNIIKKYFSFLPSNTKLVAEPGRILVSDAATLLTKVISVKKSKDKIFAIVDAGVNMIPGRDIYNYPIFKLENDEKLKVKVDIYGALCDSYDCIGVDVDLPYPKVGDILCVSNVGAYDLVRSFSWYLGLPPIILSTLEGELVQIRSRQTIEHVWYSQV